MRAVIVLWDDAGMNNKFNQHWDSADREDFPALHESSATPGQPFPYCLVEIQALDVQERMSGGGSGNKFETRDFPLTFRIFALPTANQDARQVAGDLAEEIIKIYGGHPTASPDALPLQGMSGALVTQYESDFSVALDDEVCQWSINYNVRIDAQVAV